jgi:hypothetical protein
VGGKKQLLKEIKIKKKLTNVLTQEAKKTKSA